MQGWRRLTMTYGGWCALPALPDVSRQLVCGARSPHPPRLHVQLWWDQVYGCACACVYVVCVVHQVCK